MSSNNILRLKFIKLCLIPSVLILLLFLFLVSDTIVSKIHSPNVVNSCALCPSKRNVSNNNAELMHFTILSAENHHEKINVMLIFVHAHRNLRLKNNFIQCISSLFIHTTSPLHLHILVDQLSVNNAIEILKKAAPLSRAETQVTLYDVNIFMKPLQNLIDTLRPHFSFKQGAYYGDALFYLSIGLYKISNFKQLLLIDADVKFLNDVKYLYEEFNNFPTKALIGIAREQQPVYRHILSEYRTLHNDTQIGGPPPYGKTGFNSGVLLLHLEKMQNSTIYQNIIDNSSIILTLIKKYKFKGHLGDQDFYTLISLDYPSLFYEIPCTWNRQLCQWWKHHGYSNIFNLYHNCSGKINLLHGNCNTLIPVS